MIKVTPSPFTNGKITIPGNQPNVMYLYNEVLAVAKKEKTGGIFRTDVIEISTSLKSQEDNILNKLKEIGANFKFEKK